MKLKFNIVLAVMLLAAISAAQDAPPVSLPARAL